MDKALIETVRRVLHDGVDMTIATIRPDGFPQATTVSYVSDGLKIYFGTGAQSQKTQNLGRDDRVSITVNLPYSNWDKIVGVSLAGHAHRVEAAEELRYISALMLTKFPQVANYVGNAPVEMALFRIDPTVISLLDYSKGFGHTDLVNIAA